MHLTRLTLDPRSALARRDLADPYDMHRTLTRAFVSGADDSPARFLWRLEAGSNAWATPQLLVQSAMAGNWEVLQALPGYLQCAAECRAMDQTAMLQPDRRFRFRLLANPTVTRERKRYGLVDESAQLDWLARQGERHGFAVLGALVTASERLNCQRKHSLGIVLQRVCFEGHLQVRDCDALAGALLGGIGPAKAFGCGLLSLGSA
ncbi:type I-E CRISPR-associated protein Cas6/Cse3/CasE [Pseudomonas sp. NW5]|uniref:type I-E CRISPR-associated protein Cas6/Cse3/CasE n=1 Tax=Pseudomonas sp. NW5 TaxID=2934934 RepID=UPI0020214D24|nr:type I-E CRISPR-associated protein Cas6/Cse3/CasE [Pseudomonas sp. NW5]MCL7462695.1 type I-E CRISPR-associated protein Cas6/Cse3/CasE [Pseudomonas sp. NW5]